MNVKRSPLKTLKTCRNEPNCRTRSNSSPNGLWKNSAATANIDWLREPNNTDVLIKLVDMNLLEKMKLLLRNHRSLPKKSFGQNFITDRSIYERMAEYASLEKSYTVLDIGAGLGFLSRLLAEKCKNVLAIEADEQVAAILREQLTDVYNTHVIVGDVLKADIPPFNKIVSAPPYNISSRLIPWILQQNCECGVLVFQKEFAAHLVASIGSEEYGWLSVFPSHFGEVEM